MVESRREQDVWERVGEGGEEVVVVVGLEYLNAVMWCWDMEVVIIKASTMNL
jgi:hypothetical protein